LWDYLNIRDSPAPSDVIIVLAGRPERKIFGLELYSRGFSPRLILSVGRYEVRQTVHLGFQDLNLRELTARTAPEQRHFFIEIKEESRRVFLAGVNRKGTYFELEALARQLESETPGSLILISTSIHLRRVRWCCQRIATLKRWKIRYVPVPEDMSSVRRDKWWKRFDHWSYVNAEWTKLLAYVFLHRD
jgi:hypothetical protein